MYPPSRASSNVSRASSRSGPTKPPAAPPSSTAFNAFPPRTPPAASMTSRIVTPCGCSYTPGCSTCPDRQNSRGPVEDPVPIDAYADEPSVRMGSTLRRVSTLLIAVGLPKTPCVTGNGGLFRGSPRLPSIELNRAVSSPQM